MHNCRRILLLVVFVFCARGSPANATLISPGTYIFNLDFTADVPYSWAQFTLTGPVVITAGESLTLAMYSEPNGSGILEGGLNFLPGTIFFSGFSTNDSRVLDGIFSVKVVVSGEALDIPLLTASVLDAHLEPIASVTLIPSVPEPATLALLGIGLAGIGFARRRKPH